MNFGRITPFNQGLSPTLLQFGFKSSHHSKNLKEANYSSENVKQQSLKDWIEEVFNEKENSQTQTKNTFLVIA